MKVIDIEDGEKIEESGKEGIVGLKRRIEKEKDERIEKEKKMGMIVGERKLRKKIKWRKSIDKKRIKRGEIEKRWRIDKIEVIIIRRKRRKERIKIWESKNILIGEGRKLKKEKIGNMKIEEEIEKNVERKREKIGKIGELKIKLGKVGIGKE